MAERPKRRRPPTRGAVDLAGYVEVVPGVWEPADMRDAEEWKRRVARGQEAPKPKRRREEKA
jgi:hypothetical protein